MADSFRKTTLVATYSPVRNRTAAYPTKEGAFLADAQRSELRPAARTLVEYAEGARLIVRQRLELFLKVCAAVQHGHQKGIIHRDLKPGNILVDSSGAPKVIDYGVARATESGPEATLRTAHDSLVGTLQYMSPEQLGADVAETDAQSDVYALGLIL